MATTRKSRSGAARKTTSRKTARGTPARKTSAGKAGGGKGAARKTATRKTKASKTGGGKGTARKTAARKTASGKTTARKTAGSKAAAARAPARKSRLSPKNRLAAVLERLDASFGQVNPPVECETVLDKAIYLVLREKTTDALARRAIKVLREEFVDWNEVRVSRPTELSRLMSGSSKGAAIRRFEERARRVGEMIDQIYNEKNDPSLEFLADEKPKEQLEFLEDLDDLGLHNAYALVQWLSGDDKLVLVSPEMARVSQALGLSDSAAVTKVKKLLQDLVEPGRTVALQAHLNQLGELEPSDWPNAVKEFQA